MSGHARNVNKGEGSDASQGRTAQLISAKAASSRYRWDRGDKGWRTDGGGYVMYE